MLQQTFAINKFNIYSDNEYYYFFRALNSADTKDLYDKVILDDDGNLTRIRTDLDRYEGEAKYSKDSEISLEEMVNHIKMHQRKNTNCISLSTNANVSMIYGRGYYKDNYAIVKVPKNEINLTTFNAGLYMLEQINDRINEIVETEGINELQKYFFDFIDNAATSERLSEIKNMIPEEYEPDNNYFENGLEIKTTNSMQLNALNGFQNLERDKIILKLDILKKRIINGMSNTFLMQTVANAFSSLEFIHYKEITQNELINVTSLQMDILGLLQQVPKTIQYVDEVKRIVINNLSKLNTTNFEYDKYVLDDEAFSIDEMYEMTSGKEDYKKSKYLYRTLFYLAKSKLRNENSINALKRLLGNDNKYSELYHYIDNFCFGIEPDICTRVSKDYIPISESVCFNIANSNKVLVDIINGLDTTELIDILNNPKEELKKILSDNELTDSISLSKEDWYANSIIDCLDFEALGVKEKLSDLQRNDIIISLKENNFLEVYYELKKQGVSDKNISNVLFTNLIKSKNTIDLNDSFTLEELEWFIGYNRVKGLGLNLRNYQRTADENIDRCFQNKQFTSVILPTGAGKSYVALSQLYKCRNQKCLYVAPNAEILNQLKNIIRKTYRPEEHLPETIDQTISRLFPNLVLTTYQNLKSQESNSLKDEFKDNYSLIVFDELHRTGASEWMKQVKEILDYQDNNVKVLGITATPERDVDLKNMADYWAQRYGYTDEEILGNKHLSYNLDLTDAIKLGIVANPKIINCAYSLITDGSMDNLRASIDSITDDSLKNETQEKYERLRRNVENSNGIEQILHDNLKQGSKYIVFLPITKNDQGNYEDEDGNTVDKSTAEDIIEKYQLLVRQYLFSYDYLNKEDNRVKELYLKIKEGHELSIDDKLYLEKEKKNILLLSKIDIQYKSNVLNTDTNLIAQTIINYMNWDNIQYKTQLHWLRHFTNDKVEDYSMLGTYSENKNQKNLFSFNTSKSNNIKLMFVMNKLNEGVHVDDINGIVWLRPLDANSRILYFQQLGRCIKALEPGRKVGSGNIPLVIDLVNNTLKVDLDKGTSPHEKYLSQIKYLEKWIEINGLYLRADSESEEKYFNMLFTIKKKYEKYINDNNLIQNEDVKSRLLIQQILDSASNIDLWNLEFFEKQYVNMKNHDAEKTFNLLFEINPVLSDFVLLNNKVNDSLNKFEIYYGYLKQIKIQGENVNLSTNDKIRINDDGTLTIVGKKTKKVNGKDILANQDEYMSKDLISLGAWFFYNQDKFDDDQKQRLRDIGYIFNEDKEEKFETYFKYLEQLKRQGDNVNVSQTSKIRINNDGTLTIVEKKTKKVNGKDILANQDEYKSKDLISLGNWLYVNQDKFDDDEKKRLRDIGYILMEDKKDKFETYFKYLEQLKFQGDNVNLSAMDKIRINDDGIITVIGKKTKKANGERITINHEEYMSTDLICLGSWLSKNKDKFNNQQRQRLCDIGYIFNDDKEDKFETYFKYLEQLKSQGLNVNLIRFDKIRVNDDGTLTIVGKKTKKVNGKDILANQDEYMSKDLISLGNWLYLNQDKFDDEQKQRLHDIGYILKGEKEDKFETYFKYLKQLKSQGDDVNLTEYDKIRINDDGTLTIIKKGVKRVNGDILFINREDYMSKDLISLGCWLYRNQDEFDDEQKQRLRDIGYILKGEKEDKFETYFKYLEQLKHQGDNVNLSVDDRIRINGDGTLAVVKKKIQRVNGKNIFTNHEEYMSKDLISLGCWLYKNQDKFDDEQKQRLQEIGYILKRDVNVKKQELLNIKIGLQNVMNTNGNDFSRN